MRIFGGLSAEISTVKLRAGNIADSPDAIFQCSKLASVMTAGSLSAVPVPCYSLGLRSGTNHDAFVMVIVCALG